MKHEENSRPHPNPLPQEREQRADRLRRYVVAGILWLVLFGTVGFQPLVFKRRGAGAVTGGGGGPDEISGLILWLNADAIVGLSNNDPVTTWEDGSAENNDAAQTTPSRKPTYLTGQIDSKPAVSFDGGDWMTGTITDWFGASAAEIFIVLKLDADPSAAVNDGVIWDFNGTGDDADRYPTNNVGNAWLRWGRSAIVDTGDPSQALNSWHLLDVSTASNDYKVRINGTQHFSTGTSTVAWSSGGEYFIGGSFANEGMKGKIAEIISYSKVLSGIERTNVQTWLDAKYPSLGL